MALRARKNVLIVALKARALVAHLTPEQVATFERMYRSARNEAEQNEVSQALDVQMNGWKTGSDAFSRVLQAASDIGELGDNDEDPPELTAALARSGMTFLRKPV